MDNLHGGLLSKSASAYEHLKRLATGGRLRPDRRLSPPDVAGELRVSVTPVRDALVRLAAEGFICGHDGRGYSTKSYTVQEQRDLLQLLVALTLTGLDSACEQGQPLTSSALADLETALDPSDMLPAEQAAIQFTDAIDHILERVAEASGNIALPPTVRNLLERTRYVRQLDSKMALRRLAKTTVLRGLVEAMAAGNLIGSIGLVRHYMKQLDTRLPELVAEANSAAAALKFP